MTIIKQQKSLIQPHQNVDLYNMKQKEKTINCTCNLCTMEKEIKKEDKNYEYIIRPVHNNKKQQPKKQIITNEGKTTCRSL